MKKQIFALLLATLMLFGTACVGNADTTAAASLGDIEISPSVMEYYFNDIYTTFLSYYGSAAEKVGLDTKKPLREQTMQEGKTWHDYFMESTENWVTRLLLLNKAAAEEGITLTDSEKSAIGSHVKNIDSKDPNLASIKSDVILEARLFEATAYKYQTFKKGELTPTLDEIEAAYSEDGRNAQYVDICAFQIEYDEDGDPFDKAAAEAYANELVSVKSKTEYDAVVGKILRAEDPTYEDYEIENKLEKLETKGKTYNENSKVFTWAFGAEQFDTYMLHNEDKEVYTVYILTKAPYKMEDSTVNVRYIMLYDALNGGNDANQVKAEKILEDINKTDRTAESFIGFVYAYSSDPGTYYTGGEYRNITENEANNTLGKWCFDPERKPGDTTVIRTKLGKNIILFEGEGLPKWQAVIEEEIITERFDAFVNDLNENNTVSFNESAVARIGK